MIAEFINTEVAVTVAATGDITCHHLRTVMWKSWLDVSATDTQHSKTVGRYGLHGNSFKTRGSNEMVSTFMAPVVRPARYHTLVIPKYLLIKVRKHSSSELKVN